MIIYYICDALRDLIPFVQFKKRERVLLLVKFKALASIFTKSNTPPWGVFHVFKIVQMIPNRATHNIYSFAFSK